LPKSRKDIRSCGFFIVDKKRTVKQLKQRKDSFKRVYNNGNVRFVKNTHALS
jgi:hypothetical protein